MEGGDRGAVSRAARTNPIEALRSERSRNPRFTRPPGRIFRIAPGLRQPTDACFPHDLTPRQRGTSSHFDDAMIRNRSRRMTVAQLKERMDARFNVVDQRFDAIDQRFDAVDQEDPELLRAVERLLFEDFVRGMGITLEEWKIRSHRRSERISKVRAEMQRAGLV
jgi:hypothetical protein